MEVVEIISHHVDKTQNLIIVEFRLFGDSEDFIREDFIEYSHYQDFGFDENKNFDIFESLIDETFEDDWDDDDYGYIDNESQLVSFLNEYYVVYPNKLPKAQYR
jgi:hypothetical protein